MTDNLAHSIYGGSTRKRWGECPGSVALLETIPKPPSGEHADRGTFVHAVLERCLNEKRRSAEGLLGLKDVEERFEVDQKICDDVNLALDAIWSTVDEDPASVLSVEQRFVLDVASVPAGTVFGRNDAMVYQPSKKRLVVFDYKNGYTPVDATENEQAMFYAAGAAFAEPLPLAEIDLVIIQPNAKDAEDKGAVRAWRWSVPELLDFIEDTDRAIQRAEFARAQFNGQGVDGDEWSKLFLKTGSWCDFCDAATVCPARQREIIEAGAFKFKDIKLLTVDDLPPASSFQIEDLGRLLAAIELFEGWASAVKDYAYGLAMGGAKIPGFKLVDKVARAKWQGNEDEIAAYLSLQYGIEPTLVMPPKLVTITEAEKLLGYQIKDKTALKAAKDDLRFRFTVKESSGVNLVPESHKAPEVLLGEKTFGAVTLPSPEQI